MAVDEKKKEWHTQQRLIQNVLIKIESLFIISTLPSESSMKNAANSSQVCVHFVRRVSVGISVRLPFNQPFAIDGKICTRSNNIRVGAKFRPTGTIE